MSGMRSRGLFLFCVALLWVTARPAQAGWIEDADGKTILHVKVHDWIFPDPTRTDTAGRADVAAVKAFVDDFPRLFAERYRAKYEATSHTHSARLRKHIQPSEPANPGVIHERISIHSTHAYEAPPHPSDIKRLARLGKPVVALRPVMPKPPDRLEPFVD